MRAPPEIKGLSFINRQAFLEERFGEAGFQKVLQTLTPETAKLLRTASAVDWIPLKQLLEIDLAIVGVHFGGDLAAGRIIGEYNLNRAVSKVYKTLMRLMNTGAVLQRASDVWMKIIRGGRMTVTPRGLRQCAVEVHDLDPVHPIYCEVIAGGVLGVLHAAGEKTAGCTHTQCVLKGAATCSFDVNW